MSTANMRPARVQDVDQLLDVLRSTSLSVYSKLGITKSYIYSDEFAATPLASWESAIATPSLQNLLIVSYGKNQNDVIGFGQSHVDKADKNWLSGLYVRERWQGQYIGSALLQAVLKPFDQEPVWLLTTEGTAENFYRRFGFEPTGRNAKSDPTLLLPAQETYLPQVEMLAPSYSGHKA